MKENFKLFCTLTRAYSLPISVMSWLVPFLFALFNKGNVLYGIIALFGIVVLHLASNLFDDIIDYSRELWDIKRGKKIDFNFQKGKCCCIIENKITFKKAILINIILFDTYQFPLQPQMTRQLLQQILHYLPSYYCSSVGSWVLL